PPHPEPRNGCVYDLGPSGPDWPRTNQLSAGARLRIRPRLRGAAPRGNRDRSRVSRRLLLARRRWNVVLERSEAASDGRVHDAGAESIVPLFNAAAEHG